MQRDDKVKNCVLKGKVSVKCTNRVGDNLGEILLSIYNNKLHLYHFVRTK